MNLFRVQYSTSHAAVFTIRDNKAELEKDLPGVSTTNNYYTITRIISESLTYINTPAIDIISNVNTNFCFISVGIGDTAVLQRGEGFPLYC